MPRQCGSNVIFTLTASNAGTARTNVTDVPAGYTFVSNTAPVQEHIQAEQAFGQ
jgi:uncharacterized repeat protein (TIGR01451 family)